VSDDVTPEGVRLNAEVLWKAYQQVLAENAALKASLVKAVAAFEEIACRPAYDWTDSEDDWPYVDGSANYYPEAFSAVQDFASNKAEELSPGLQSA